MKYIGVVVALFAVIVITWLMVKQEAAPSKDPFAPDINLAPRIDVEEAKGQLRDLLLAPDVSADEVRHAQGLLRVLKGDAVLDSHVVELAKVAKRDGEDEELVRTVMYAGLQAEIRLVDLPDNATDAINLLEFLIADFASRYLEPVGRLWPFYREMASRYGEGSEQSDELFKAAMDREPECWRSWIIRSEFWRAEGLGREMHVEVGKFNSEDYLGQAVGVVAIGGDMDEFYGLRLRDAAKLFSEEDVKFVCILTPGGRFQLNQLDFLKSYFDESIEVIVDEDYEFLNRFGGTIQPCFYLVDRDGRLVSSTENANSIEPLVDSYLREVG